MDVIDKLMLSYKGFLLFSKIHRHVSRLIIHCGCHWQYLVEERSAGAENWAFNISSKVIGYLSRHSREAGWIEWTKEQFYQRHNIHFWTIIPFLHIHIFPKPRSSIGHPVIIVALYVLWGNFRQLGQFWIIFKYFVTGYSGFQWYLMLISITISAFH